MSDPERGPPLHQVLLTYGEGTIPAIRQFWDPDLAQEAYGQALPWLGRDLSALELRHLCCVCLEPVVDGQARYTAQEPEKQYHYACHERRQDRFRSAMEQFDEAARQFEKSLAELGAAIRTTDEMRRTVDGETTPSYRGLYTDIIKE